MGLSSPLGRVFIVKECYEDNAGNREALEYGKQLKYDILQHVHDIITESKLEQKDLHQDLTVKADIEKQKLIREQKEAETKAMQL